jgi:hypothetical protein
MSRDPVNTIAEAYSSGGILDIVVAPLLRFPFDAMPYMLMDRRMEGNRGSLFWTAEGRTEKKEDWCAYDGTLRKLAGSVGMSLA